MRDQSSDMGGYYSHRIAVTYMDGNLPTTVKAASAARTIPPGDMPPSAFADPYTRTFPCHTKEATLTSALYFYAQQAEGADWDSAYPAEKVAQRLGRAAGFFGAAQGLNDLRTRMESKASEMRRELTPADYALVANYDGMPVLRFPIVNAPTTKKAACALYEFRRRYPYAWRKSAALRILERAAAYGADLPEPALSYVIKAAGLYPADNASASRHIAHLAVQDPALDQSTLAKVAEAVASGVADTPANRDNLCESLDAYSHTAAKSGAYVCNLLPEEMLYALPSPKSASAPEAVTLATGNTYYIANLLEAGLDVYRTLGDDVAAALVDESGALDADKLADVLPTLPRPDAVLLETALQGFSIHPAESDKAAGRRRGADSMFDDLDGWSRFLRERGSTPNACFTISAPLRHDDDVHAALAAV